MSELINVIGLLLIAILGFGVCAVLNKIFKVRISLSSDGYEMVGTIFIVCICVLAYFIIRSFRNG